MSRSRHLVVTSLALAAATACGDRTPTGARLPAGAPPRAAPAALRPDRLAQLFARALESPAFRAYVKAQLDASPYPEHKIALQRFLPANSGRALRYLAQAGGTNEPAVQRELDQAIPLEVYLPVPAHRAAWKGDAHVLVATALADREAPIAFDPTGHRYVLSADTPPATPVIAIVPVETDFSAPPVRAPLQCDGSDCNTGGGGGGTSTPPAGLYMRKSHIQGDFEGWLKGAPEYEVHILGQLGQSDSLKDYACAGEHASEYYRIYDQNDADWSGNVLLFTQAQIDDYRTKHSGQGVRVFVVEDDDTACQIKADNTSLNHLIASVDSINRQLTGGRDTSTVVARYWWFVQLARKIWSFAAGLIKTNDDLVGNAVDARVVGDLSHTGFNWILKGDKNTTNGWIDLEMR